MVETNLMNQNSKITPKLLPLVLGSKNKFDLILTEELLDKIKYLCSEFPSREWSGVLFYNYEGDISNIESFKLKAFDLYPLDLGTATYTEFSHSTDFAGYIARHPELMDARQGLIHSHNNMSTFFSGRDEATLQEMSPEYGSYLSLIVNNAGSYTAAIGVTTSVETETKKNFKYKSLDYSEKSLEDVNKETKDIVLRFNANIIKERAGINDEEFINSVEELKKNKEKQSYNNRTYSSVVHNQSNINKTSPITYTYPPNVTLPLFENDNKTANGSNFNLDNLSISFISKLITQGYFYTVDKNLTFSKAVSKSMELIPKDLSVLNYSIMVYEMIEPLLFFLDICKEEDQAMFISDVMEKFQSFITISDYHEEIYQAMDSFLSQIIEDYIDPQEEEIQLGLNK